MNHATVALNAAFFLVVSRQTLLITGRQFPDNVSELGDSVGCVCQQFSRKVWLYDVTGRYIDFLLTTGIKKNFVRITGD